jgi:hypothetical protein
MYLTTQSNDKVTVTGMAVAGVIGIGTAFVIFINTCLCFSSNRLFVIG